ncbi:hypothetical protein GLOTRDRAFT_134774 [Gloeophyllum trabeum ATCC 11539]|uniref:UbiA prenyltransferase n=1 Tax=Gloeophyllum trabeum (strain ATCC 11539 / FP-39264 / Madison 617) TaxID=670483 RepID=S7RYK2_GLOTA|nr:uncharacterized protein GLOTRDRAFT_134774 [Gloeophyllum trabeum ATCC 11539]EPQ59995.1 hypothetical protein GLOTRDRAFT_134774 [Gloeophyllum trabeum ATCC 11539]
MRILQRTRSLIAQECAIFFRFSWRDWSTTLIPGSLLSIAAMRSTTMSLQSAIVHYACAVMWLTLFVYFVDLSNQITGIDEDRVNKPDRPLPSGLVTLEGARMRWTTVLAGFSLIGIFYPVILPETLCWVATVAFLNLTPAGNHWFGKNCIAMTTGTWALLSGCWKIIAPLSATHRSFILTVAVWTGILMPIQDFRDMKGDARVGRRTMQLVYGDITSRRIYACGFVPAAYAVLRVGRLADIAPIPLALAHVYLAYRTMNHDGPRYDHKTYMHFTYLFCAVVASIIVKQH